MTRVLLAFDKFKDALTATQAVDAAATALRTAQPDWSIESAPLADGGEGFAAILTQAAGGEFVTKAVTGPHGRAIKAAFGFVSVEKIPSGARAMLRLPDLIHAKARIAVIEMAAASGLAALSPEERDPRITTTLGTGELMQIATAAGVVAIVLGVGGSATNDLGLGALTALGLRSLDACGNVVTTPVPARWPSIVAIEGAVLTHLPPVYIACDVTNPLLGPRGAVSVYGRQKGLREEHSVQLESGSERIAEMLCASAGKSTDLKNAAGTGAAGGIAFGLMAAANAKLLPGFELVSAWLDLDRKIAAADIVLTGEGRFDETSMEGKGPGAIAAQALSLGKIVHVFAGQVTAIARPGMTLHTITPAGMPLAHALRNSAPNLHAKVRSVFATGDLLSQEQ